MPRLRPLWPPSMLPRRARHIRERIRVWRVRSQPLLPPFRSASIWASAWALVSASGTALVQAVARLPPVSRAPPAHSPLAPARPAPRSHPAPVSTECSRAPVRSPPACPPPPPPAPLLASPVCRPSSPRAADSCSAAHRRRPASSPTAPAVSRARCSPAASWPGQPVSMAPSCRPALLSPAPAATCPPVPAAPAPPSPPATARVWLLRAPCSQPMEAARPRRSDNWRRPRPTRIRIHNWPPPLTCRHIWPQSRQSRPPQLLHIIPRDLRPPVLFNSFFCLVQYYMIYLSKQPASRSNN
ncbi:unnamed protein product [Protopolystoma xenopodis]|uniref:Uncharacterized protein n=1 Tax=Protopolystoma xenopodis TaxID=117903 RepID=A0A448X2C8_9PLAT|nr:unnamed protein product [Protopolystoma xenopodis]